MVAGSKVRLMQVPFDSGIRGARMGAGPPVLAEAGAARRLRDRGHEVDERVLEPPSPAGWQAELRTAFELHHVIAGQVRAARTAQQLPVVLSGNCNATIGVLAGLTHPAHRVGLIWLDAHGDFNTPETDTSGFLDGHGLAMAVGRCWQALTGAVPGFYPLLEQHVLLVGARSLNTGEQEALIGSGVQWIRPEQARQAHVTAAALDHLIDTVDVLHFHVDLDVHDPSIAPANGYAELNGLLAEHVHRLLRQSAERAPVVSATLASYDPTFDHGWRMRDTALDLIELLADIGTPTDA